MGMLETFDAQSEPCRQFAYPPPILGFEAVPQSSDHFPASWGEMRNPLVKNR